MDAATIVKRVRALSGITRQELAEVAGIAPSTVGRIERGTLDPTWGTLSRILEATGYRINGDTVVSAGDSTAIAAARPAMEAFLESSRTSASEGGLTPSLAIAEEATESIKQWRARWARTGWLSETANVEDVVALAISAGNAARIPRRNVARRVVVAEGGWRVLATRLGDTGIPYAVSGLVATRKDRATAVAVNPVIYVEDPAHVVEELDLREASPGEGVLLIAPENDELERPESEEGIRFVSRAQGVLDAFAGAGREPDKAEELLRSLLEVGA